MARVGGVSRVAGVVLAGGLATRMGGGQKALRKLGGKTLLERVLHRLQDQVDTVAINANRDVAQYEPFGYPVLRDGIENFPGPLAGVLAGLRWAGTEGFSHIATVAGDTPFFPTDLVAKLKPAAGPIALAATRDAERGEMRQPTFGLWPVDLADDLEEALNDGVRKIVLWADKHGVGTVAFDPEPIDPFFNVNTPDDMVEAERLVAEFNL